MVIFDSNFALHYFSGEKILSPIDPSTKKEIAFFKERVSCLVDFLESTNEIIAIPSPVLAEIAIKSELKTVEEYLKIINKGNTFSVLNFDVKSAIEFAKISKLINRSGNKRQGSSEKDTWAKVKFDRQIIAIAKANSISRIYSSDKGMIGSCKFLNIECVSMIDIKMPSHQAEIYFE